METTPYRAPRLSRAKALIGAALATLAIAGTVQATAAEPASAMRNQCMEWVELGHYFESLGMQTLANHAYDEFNRCVGLR